MQLKWPAAFSILNGPTRFYHTASFPLSRNNWQHGFSFHKHLPGLSAHRLATIHNATSPKSKCTVSLSASAYIVHMGLDKIWRNIQPRAPKLSKETCEVSQSESRVSSSLQPQQLATGKQLEQDLIHCPISPEVFTYQGIELERITPAFCQQSSPASSAPLSSLRATPTEIEPEAVIVQCLK